MDGDNHTLNEYTSVYSFLYLYIISKEVSKMNPIKVFPIILLLLISLSVTSYAGYHWGYHECYFTQESPYHTGGCILIQGIMHHDTNQIEFFVAMNDSGDVSPVANVVTGSNQVYLKIESGNAFGTIANTTSTCTPNTCFTLKSPTFTLSCSEKTGGIRLCSGSSIIPGAQSYTPGASNNNTNVFLCNATTLRYPYGGASMDVNAETYFGDGNYQMAGVSVAFYRTSDNAFIGGSTFSGIAMRQSDLPVDGNTQIWYNRDDPVCGYCQPENAVTCASNVTKESQRCIIGAQTFYQTCAQGGWNVCGLSNYTQCPASSITITEPSMIECTNNTDCSSNEVCTNGFTVKNPITCITTLGTMYENVPACGETNTRYCMLADEEPCTDLYQCASYSCKGKDATGVGWCTKVCSLNPTTDCHSTGTCVKATETSESAQTLAGVSYCIQSQKSFCSGNDQCGTDNCKTYCGGNIALDYGHCLPPTYECFCATSADCAVGESCTTIPPYPGPIALGNTLMTPNGATSILKYCAVGIADGQTCTSSSQCSSNNCQNGYCCGYGKVCCSSDSQCSGGKVCFNNAAWSSTTLYRTCDSKRGYLLPCFENKECITQPCNPISGMAMGLCNGVPIPTYATYTTDLPSGNIIGINIMFNVTVLYKFAANNSLVPLADCRVYVGGIYQSEVSCSSPIPMIISVPGTYQITITASGYGLANATIGPFFVTIVNTGTNQNIGSPCTINSQCTTNRCSIFTKITPTRCHLPGDCTSGSCIGYKSQELGILCEQECNSIFDGTCYGATCITLGTCSGLDTYGACSADDSFPGCIPSLYPGDLSTACTNQGYSCNPSSYTCSLRTIPLGQECNLSTLNECASGGTCIETQTNSSKGVCCIGSKVTDYCCNQASDCFTTDGNLCNSYRCELKVTGAFDKCSNNGMCDVINGYGCTPAYGLTSVGIADGTYICQAFPCSNGQTPCAFCNNGSTHIPAELCTNLTRSIECALSDTSCITSGGSITSKPPVTTTITPGTVNPEFLFQQLINLAFYTFIVAILFMVIALVVAGFTLAYSLIKR